jgi:hypothetical protein
VYASRRVGWVDTHDDELGLGVGGKVALDDGEFVAFGGAESGASGVEEGEHHDPPPKRRQRGLVSTWSRSAKLGAGRLWLGQTIWPWRTDALEDSGCTNR